MIWRRRQVKNKFGAVRTADGFPSKLEASVYQMLQLREKAGELKDIQRQASVTLSEARIRYKADFSAIVVATGGKIYIEAKGAETERFRMIKKLWAAYMREPLEIWKGHWRRPVLVETIVPSGTGGVRDGEARESGSEIRGIPAEGFGEGD